MRVLRYLGAVLAAGTAFWLCPVLLAFFVFLTDTKLDNLGQIDNAPYRAALLLLILTPFAVVMFGSLFLVTSAVLRRLHGYSFHTLVIASIIVAVCIGAMPLLKVYPSLALLKTLQSHLACLASAALFVCCRVQ
jgi:hypothetical protein